jgi:hypothetical protein
MLALSLALLMLGAVVLGGCVGDPVVSVRVVNPCDTDLVLRYWEVQGEGEPDDQASGGVPVRVYANSSDSYGLFVPWGSRTVLVVRIDEIGLRERFESSGIDVTHEVVITEQMCPDSESQAP